MSFPSKTFGRAARKWIRGWPYICDNEFARAAMATMYDRLRRRELIVNPYLIYGVSPNHVTRALTTKSYNNRRCFDYQHPGDWDLRTVKIRDMRVFLGLYQRFVQQQPWKENVLAPHNMVSVDWPEPRKYIAFNDEQFLARAKALDSLWESLNKNGNMKSGATEFSDLLNVAIGRDGRLIRICSGLHRLIMSQFIGLNAVPVRISIIHEKCQRPRQLLEL